MKTKFYFILLAVCCLTLGRPIVSLGQSQEVVQLSTPYEALTTYFVNLQRDNYKPEIAAAVFNPAHSDSTQARKLAIQLKQVLDGKGVYVDVEAAPDSEEFLDSVSMRSRYVLTPEYPDIALQKVGASWYFSRSSIDRIPEMHSDAFPLGTDRLLTLLPKTGHYNIFGLEFWQIVGIFILILISFILHKILRIILSGFISRLLNKYGEKADIIRRVRPVVIPLSYSLIVIVVKFFIPVLQLSAELSYWLNLLVSALNPLFITIAAYRFVDIIDIYFTRLSQKTETTLDDQLVPVVRKALKTFVVIIGTLVILQMMDFDILPLLAGLSVGGIAVALAAQDTIKNFFGSIMIFIDRPFQIGHWITSGDIDGTVEEVGIRSTRVRTFRNSVMYVPNAKLADSMIDNHGLRVYRRFFTNIAVTYDTPADLIDLFVSGLRKVVDQHPNTRKDYYEIHLNDMASSSLNIMFYVFFTVPSWSDELRCRHEILLSIIKLAEQLGVSFAFPTQTLHIENLPGHQSLSPTYQSAKELKPRLEEFLERNKK